MPLQLVSPVQLEPVTLAEAKGHLRVTSSDEDGLIDALIVAARSWAENFTGRALLPQVWDYFLNCFEDPIEIPRPPLISVASIKYVDTDGVLQTLATTEYSVDTAADRGLIRLAYGKTWPSIRSQANAVTVRFTAGYADAATMPAPIRSACLLIIGELYERRETTIVGTIINEVPISAEYLLWPYRSLRF